MDIHPDTEEKKFEQKITREMEKVGLEVCMGKIRGPTKGNGEMVLDMNGPQSGLQIEVRMTIRGCEKWKEKIMCHRDQVAVLEKKFVGGRS